MSLFEKIGGAPAVKAVVADFYKRILNDSLLIPYFKHTDMAKQHMHQEMFITMALGGPNSYQGRDMKSAHKGLGITNEAFDAVAGHLSDALIAAGVSQSDKDTIIGNIAGLRSDVVEK